MQIPWSALGDHAYEGDLNVACDNAPLTFIELAGQSITDTSNELEQIEIVH
jgi:hypothetical protein